MNVEPLPCLNTEAQRLALVELIEKTNATHAITLTYADSVPLKDAHRTTRALMARIDHAILGPRWQRKADKRTFALFLPEKPAHALHLHGVLRVYPSAQERFGGLLVKQRNPRTYEEQLHLPLWREIVPSGTCVVTPLFSLTGWADYCTKSFQPEALEHLIILP